MKTFSAIFIVIMLALAAIPIPHGSAQEVKNPVAPGNSEPTSSEGKIVVVDSWELIKDWGYAQRADFIASLSRLAERVDEQTRALSSKRDHLTEASAKDWDFAMKELEAARSDLQSKVTDLSKARAETWNDARDKVGIAWQRVQDAFDKVKSSTTS